MLETKGLDSIFYPKSIAVIGASRKRGSVGAELFHNLLKNSYQGVVYPVNPSAKFVQAVRAYPSIQSIPDPVDLAIIVVPKKFVLKTVEDCVEKQVKAIVIISAGFKEVGEEGAELEQKIFKLCREKEIRLVGPNCMGVLNTDPEASMDATFAPTYPPHGSLSFSSQSGALGHGILEYAKDLGIGVSKFISVGNKADVSANDLIQYWADDEMTKVILLYLESFGNSRKFVDLARHVGRKKPIVAVKSGRTATGARAAASHTGSLASSDVVVQALFQQTGVIRVDSVEDLFDVAMLLSNQPLPKGRKVAILTNAGGPGILAADACESWDLEVPSFSEKTIKELKKLVSAQASIGNPIDLTANGTPEIFGKAIPLLLEDPNVDSLIVIYVPPLITRPKDVADKIVEAVEGTDKTVITCFMGKHGVPEGLKRLKKGHIPSFMFPESAIGALGRVADHVDWRAREDGEVQVFDDFNLDVIERISKKSGWLHPVDAYDLLEAARIPIEKPVHVSSLEEAVEKSKQLGFPVVLKIDSKKILHKSDMGGVALRLMEEEEVKEAGKQMLDKASEMGVSRQEVEGFYLQRMLEGGIEVIVGANHDAKFGMLFMFGLGGVQVELFKDVAFRLHPLTDQDVKDMIEEVRGVKLLKGYRGSPPSDIQGIELVIQRLGHLAKLMPNLREFDLNPIRVFPEGLKAIDCRIRLA